MKNKTLYFILTVLTFHISACYMMRAKMKTYYRKKITLPKSIENLDCSFEARDKNIYYFSRKDIMDHCYDEKYVNNFRHPNYEALYYFLQSRENLNFKYELERGTDTLISSIGKDSIIPKIIQNSEITRRSRGMESLKFALLVEGKGQVFIKDEKYYPKYIIFKKTKRRPRSVIFVLELPNKKNLISNRIMG